MSLELFFGLVGVLALLFAIPFAIVANVLTPYVKNWWAGRSRGRLKRRIEALERELAEAERLPMLTATEESFLDLLSEIHSMVGRGVLVVIFMLWVTSSPIKGQLFPNFPSALRVLATGTVVFGMYSLFAAFMGAFRRGARIVGVCNMRSPVYRASLRRQIDTLSDKLEKLQAASASA